MIRGLFMVALSFAPILSVAGEIHAVEVFTDGDHPVRHSEAVPGVVIYRLDALSRILKAVSEGLPKDEQEAASVAAERLSRLDRDRLENAARALALARFRYGLERIPAVVFDGRAVIYGVTDLALARQLYEARR